MTGVCLYEGPVSLLSILPLLFQSVCCQSVSAFPVQHSDILKCIHFQSRHSETGDTKSFVPPFPKCSPLSVVSECLKDKLRKKSRIKVRMKRKGEEKAEIRKRLNEMA